jgi:phosphatidylinositol-3-phosphatase
VRRIVAAALAVASLAACGAEGKWAPEPTGRPADAPSFGRVAIVVMENKEYGQIIGNPKAPFLNRFARANALARNYFAITRPSLPNYLALLGGDTFGIGTNCSSCHVAGPNLVDQLEEAHISWKGYMEDLPGACFRGDSAGGYARKHNPFLYFDSIRTDAKRCSKVVPLRALDNDIAARGVPRFVWITPNLCNDMHDCGVEAGDRFLERLVPRVLGTLGPHGILIITFDEGVTTKGCCVKARGGHIATIVAGPAARPGTYDQPLDHYSILRAIEDGFGLKRLNNAACPCTPSMDPLFR